MPKRCERIDLSLTEGYYDDGDDMKRKIYKELEKWKATDVLTPMMIIGARQVGKTYIIREFCKREFEEVVEINLFEHPEIIEIFSRQISTEEKFKRLELYLDAKINIEKTIIFFDEVQESEAIISALKYFNEHEMPYKIICAGSLLGVKLKRFHASFPVGKVRMIHMYPMDFEEFLMANGNDLLIAEICQCYENMQPMDGVLHEKMLHLYRMYLCIGGMPDAVQNFIRNDKDVLSFDADILRNIITSYTNDMQKYVTNMSESVRIENLYNSIPSQLGNQSNKFQYSKIKQGAKSRDYDSAESWLLASNMVFKCNLLTHIEIPPQAFRNEKYFKLYLSDSGLLATLLEVKYGDIILDKSFLYKGVIAENYVANQFVNNDFTLYYWKSGNEAEIDFILYTKDGLVPVEVKAGDSVKSKSLQVYMNKFKPDYAIRLSTRNFGFVKGIKSIPLYAAFCIKNN